MTQALVNVCPICILSEFCLILIEVLPKWFSLYLIRLEYLFPHALKVIYMPFKCCHMPFPQSDSSLATLA